MKIPYGPHPLAIGSNALAPLLEVRIQGPTRARRLAMLVDSGSDVSTLPSWLAEDLGLKPVRAESQPILGAGGMIHGWPTRARILTPAGSYDDELLVTDDPIGVLGQHGSFKQHWVAFDARGHGAFFTRRH